MKRILLQLFFIVCLLWVSSCEVASQERQLLKCVASDASVVVMADVAKICALGGFEPQKFLSIVNWKSEQIASTATTFVELLENPSLGLQLNTPVCIFNPKGAEGMIMLADVWSTKTLKNYLRNVARENDDLEFYSKGGIFGCYDQGSCLISNGKVLLFGAQKEGENIDEFITYFKLGAKSYAKHPAVDKLLAARGEVRVAMQGMDSFGGGAVSLKGKEGVCMVVDLCSRKGSFDVNVTMVPVTAQGEQALAEFNNRSVINGGLIRYIPTDADAVLMIGKPDLKVSANSTVAPLAALGGPVAIISNMLGQVSGDVMAYAKGLGWTIMCEVNDDFDLGAIVQAIGGDDVWQASGDGYTALLGEQNISVGYRSGVLKLSNFEDATKIEVPKFHYAVLCFDDTSCFADIHLNNIINVLQLQDDVSMSQLEMKLFMMGLGASVKTIRFVDRTTQDNMNLKVEFADSNMSVYDFLKVNNK